MVYLLEDESLVGELVGGGQEWVGGDRGSMVGDRGSMGAGHDLLRSHEPSYNQDYEPSHALDYPSSIPPLPSSPIPPLPSSIPPDTPCTPQQLVISLADRIPILANTYMFGFQTEEDALYQFEDTEDSPVLVALTTVTCALIDRLGDTFHSQIWEVCVIRVLVS